MMHDFDSDNVRWFQETSPLGLLAYDARDGQGYWQRVRFSERQVTINIQGSSDVSQNHGIQI